MEINLEQVVIVLSIVWIYAGYKIQQLEQKVHDLRYDLNSMEKELLDKNILDK